jgi:hypothetical protein
MKGNTNESLTLTVASEIGGYSTLSSAVGKW